MIKLIIILSRHFEQQMFKNYSPYAFLDVVISIFNHFIMMIKYKKRSVHFQEGNDPNVSQLAF